MSSPAKAALVAALAALLLGVLNVIAFSPSLRGDFVWDDRPLIVDNPTIRDPKSLGRLLTSGFWQTGDRHDRFRSFYRPMVSASFAADNALWGTKPLGFRLTNLMLHTLCALLVLRLALGEKLHPLAAILGAALFAVHPVHVESVAWISGRTDVLCAVFVLLALVTHRRAEGAPPGRSWRAVSLACFALALISKEMAAPLPILIAADRILAQRGRPRRVLGGVLVSAPYVAVLGIGLLLRQLALGGEAEPLYRLSMVSHAATALFVLGRYVALLLLPAGLDAHYPYQALPSLASPLAMVSAVMLAVIAAVWWGCRRASPAIAFWILWIFVSLAPVLAFGTFGDVLMADRFLYIPSVGLALLSARGLSAILGLPGWRRVARTALRASALAAGCLIVVLLAVPCARRAALWTDDLRLFTDMVRTSPDSPMVRCNLGLAHYGRGEFQSAIQELARAIELAPSFAMAYNNLAAALELEGRLEEALAVSERALAIAPLMVESLINNARVRVRLGQRDRGLRGLSAVVESHPRYTPALYAYADALDQVGRSDESLFWALRCLAIDRDYASAHYLVGKILAERGDSRRAAASMRRFLELWPGGGSHVQAARRVIAVAEGG